MLSYRHSFHAGNHGDVLKHICQMLVLEKLAEKPKPFVYIDTHSAAGLYDLQSEEAQKTSEYKSGFNLINGYKGNNETINAYIKLASEYSANNQYPGSPEIARRLCREQDSIVLTELHNSEIQNLKRNIVSSNVEIHHRDGFEGLKGLTPPKPARGLVLIDPPYEMADEYVTLSKTLTNVLNKWQTGIFMIWYPLLSPRAGKKYGQSEKMLQRLATLPVKNLVNVTLNVEDPEKDTGMYGSGIALINAPWQFDTKIGRALPDLTALLGVSDKAGFSVEWLVEAQ